MPKKPNTRPTSIYWLIDVRPEILREYPDGYPFYCGKTVQCVTARLSNHFTGSMLLPERKLSTRLQACKNHIRILTVEIVPHSQDWAERECYWISRIRSEYPDNCNLADGGQGAAGYVQSAETIAKRVASRDNPAPMTPEETKRWIAYKAEQRARRAKNTARASRDKMRALRAKIIAERKARRQARKAAKEANAQPNPRKPSLKQLNQAALQRRLAKAKRKQPAGAPNPAVPPLPYGVPPLPY